MATITTDTYLDDGTARTAGEAWTCNGGILTVRTDSRWHAGSPASMTGSLGTVTLSSSLGGGYYIDGTKVRWMPFNAGSGNVPAIGTTVSGGTSGASGYLLGVWGSLTSAPTAVGDTMPTTGFLKFREVTGSFVTSEVLSGITATSSGADVVGWIEVVHDINTVIITTRLNKFQVRGSWFDLGTTTGSANQSIQLPTNGSTTTYIPGVWIANTSSPTTDDDYDFYPAVDATRMSTTNLGTDIRSKFVLMGTDGTIKIGHNGTTNVGYVPPSGRAIRIPNVFGRQCLTSTRATNALPDSNTAVRPEFDTTSAGNIDVVGFVSDWYFGLSQAYSVNIENTAVFDRISVIECATRINLYDVGNGMSAALNYVPWTIRTNYAGVDMEKLYCFRTTTGNAIDMLDCTDCDVYNIYAGQIPYAHAGSGFRATRVNNSTIEKVYSLNSFFSITSCFDTSFVDMDYTDRLVGSTPTTDALDAFVFIDSSNCILNGMTLGINGTISDVHPYAAMISVTSSQNVTVRNIGSRTNMLSGGSANQTRYLINSGGYNTNCRFQRCYMNNLRDSTIYSRNEDTNLLFEHVYGDFNELQYAQTLNMTLRNFGGSNSVSAQPATYGVHFYDMFTSDTTGRVILSMQEPTSVTIPYVTTVAGTPKFTSVNNIVMKTLNDEVIWEMPYFTIGHTAFENTAPTVTGTNVTFSSGATWGNHDIYYQIDTGSGYGGSWKDLNATNLSSETITASTGFKLKIRVVCNTSATNNSISFIRINTTSTLSAQTNNLYPLDTVSLSISDFITGSDVVVYQAGTETVLGSVDAYAGTSWNYQYETPTDVDIGVFLAGYIPYYIRGYALGTTNASVFVVQVPDRAYLT